MGAQLLFERMIVQADDQGRLPGEPSVLKGLCMPLIPEATTIRVKKWRDQLAKEELIHRYGNEPRTFVQLNGWWEHQGNMRRAYPSRFPAPPSWEDRVIGVGSAGQSAGTSLSSRGEKPGDSPTISPRSAVKSSPIARAEARPDPIKETSVSSVDSDEVTLGRAWEELTGRSPSEEDRTAFRTMLVAGGRLTAERIAQELKIKVGERVRENRDIPPARYYLRRIEELDASMADQGAGLAKRASGNGLGRASRLGEVLK